MEGEPGALEAWGQTQAGEAGEVTWSRSEAWRENGDDRSGLGSMRPRPAEPRGRLCCSRILVHEGEIA